MSDKHSPLTQRALKALGYKDYSEYIDARKAAHEAMADNPEFQEEMAFLRSGVPAGYTVVPHDIIVRMARVIYWSVQYKTSIDCMQRGTAFSEYELATKALTPDDLQHIERLAKGECQ